MPISDALRRRGGGLDRIRAGIEYPLRMLGWIERPPGGDPGRVALRPVRSQSKDRGVAAGRAPGVGSKFSSRRTISSRLGVASERATRLDDRAGAAVLRSAHGLRRSLAMNDNDVGRTGQNLGRFL
jgi:hypothetical protein